MTKPPPSIDPETSRKACTEPLSGTSGQQSIPILDIHAMSQPTELQRLAEAVMTSKCRVEQLKGQTVAEQGRMAELVGQLNLESERILREIIPPTDRSR